MQVRKTQGPWNLYMKTLGLSFTLSKNFTIFNDLKTGLVCSVKDEKVIMRIAHFCSMSKGFTFDSLVLPQAISEYIKTDKLVHSKDLKVY